MTVDEHNEVVKLLIKVGKKLNKSSEQIGPFIKTIVTDNWLESVDSLKKLKDDDWDKLNLPILFLKEIKQELYSKENENELGQEKEKGKERDQNGDKSNDIYQKAGKNIIYTEETPYGSNSSSNSNVTSNRTPTRNKNKMEQIKHDNKNKDGNEKYTKKIKKNTMEDVMKDRGIASSMSNKIPMMNRGILPSTKKENPENIIYEEKPMKKEHSEFPFIKFNVEVYNELIMCGVQEIDVENVFYFSYEEECDSLLKNDVDKDLSTRDKYDKHSADLYNAADRLKRIDTNSLKGVIEILSKIIRNILITPKMLKTRILKCTNNIIKERILKYRECVNFLESLGFVLIQSFYVLQKVNCIVLTCAYETLENLAKNYNIILSSLPKKYFNPYKASIICTDSFKAKTILGNDNSDKILKQKKEELNKLMSQTVELKPRIYKQQRKSVKQYAVKEPHISDAEDEAEADAGEPNSNDDVSFIMSKIKNLYKEQTFQSKTKMEIQKISKTQVYVKTVLKILFPDQHILELNFSPCTSMKQVHDCIKKFLSSNIASKEWFIYEPPLIKKFDLQKKLKDYNLVPCAFLRFKVHGVVNNTTDEGYFSNEAIEKYYVIL